MPPIKATFQEWNYVTRVEKSHLQSWKVSTLQSYIYVYSILQIHYDLLIHSLVDGYLHYFQFLPIMNKAVNIVFVSLGKYLGENCWVYGEQGKNCFSLFYSCLQHVWCQKWEFSTPHNSDTNFLELAQTPQIKGSVPQDCSPLQTSIVSSRSPGYSQLLSNLATN